MNLVVEPVWSLPLVLVVATALVILVLWTYPPRVAHLSPFWRRSLITLRCCATAVLILAMFRPSFQLEETDKQTSQLILLVDRSRSMSTPDGPGGLSRRAEVLKLLEDSKTELEALKKDVDIQFLDFASELTAVPFPENTADGDFTAIGKSLDELREDVAGERLIGTLIMSDGAQRAGGDDDVDPVSAARRFAEQLGAPIHSLTIGTSNVSSSGIDLAIQDLQLDQPVTFEKKTVPVHLQLKLLGAAGKKVKVQLLIEDRNGKREGESGVLVPIPLSSEARPFRDDIQTNKNSETIPLDLSFVADKPGDYKIAAEVVPDPGEVKLDNNRIETLITVRKGGLRVAYFDIPRPEQKFLRRLNETAKIQIDTQVILPGAFAKQTSIDPELFEKDKYDVYIIGDVPASVFTNSGKNLLGELALRVTEGAGLIMIGGLTNFEAGGYGSTPLATLLPVKMDATVPVSMTEGQRNNQLNSKVKMLPTGSGNDRFLMSISATRNRETWNQLPPLGGATKLEPKSGAVEVIAESQTGAPLLLATETGRGRVLAFGGDETWKWHLHGHSAEHQRFWQQTILWLAHKEFDSDKPLWTRVEPRNFSPMSKVSIEFGAQTTEGLPIPDANFQVEVLTPSGETVKVPPQRLGDQGIGEFLQTQAPGDYWVRVSGTHQGESLGLPATTRFVVDARDIEMDQPAADPALLAEISDMTGGVVVSPDDFASFLKRLREEGIPETAKRFRRISLWDGWIPLLIFILFLSIEWAIRKTRGMA